MSNTYKVCFNLTQTLLFPCKYNIVIDFVQKTIRGWIFQKYFTTLLTAYTHRIKAYQNKTPHYNNIEKVRQRLNMKINRHYVCTYCRHFFLSFNLSVMIYNIEPGRYC